MTDTMAGWRVPLFDARFGDTEEAAVLNVVRSGWLTMGEQVQRLESRFSEEFGGAHALAVTNGTAALHLAYTALGIGPGDEVIVPSMTFVATANAVRYCGAKPVFAEISGLNDPCIDPADVERRITPRTRAIGVVHYTGFPCDMVALQRIARDHNLKIVEDCAHSLFSSLDGVRCGLWGDAAAFSFFSNKNMTCGEGGLVVSRDDAVAETCRLDRSHGMTSVTLDRHKGRAVSYDVLRVGYNYRLDEIRAALALAQLDRLPAYLAERKSLWRRYCQALESVPGIGVPDFGGRSDDVGVHIFPLTLPEGTSREGVLESLKARRIQTSIHYPPIHTFSAYADEAVQLPKTEAFGARELTLPFFPGMTDEQVDLVASALRDALSQALSA
jgi:dTDP-4-amino-4,6-dideoxygalactose transaminase